MMTVISFFTVSHRGSISPALAGGFLLFQHNCKGDGEASRISGKLIQAYRLPPMPFIMELVIWVTCLPLT